MKIACTPSIVRNYWDYYLLKWGLKGRVSLNLNTAPDNYVLELSREVLREDRYFLKTLFMLINCARIEYHKPSNKFIIYSADKKTKKELVGSIFLIETFEKAVDVFDKLENYDENLFRVEVRGARFLIRKKYPRISLCCGKISWKTNTLSYILS